MIKIAVCDDGPTVALCVKNILLEHQFVETLEIDTFDKGQELYESAMKKKYDIVIMDIELTDTGKSDKYFENGMLLSNRIKDINSETIMIFFSGKGGYEKELLNFEPFRFVGKPVFETKQNLYMAVRDAIDRLRNWRIKYEIKLGRGIWTKIDLKNVFYFSSMRPRIIVKMIDETLEYRGRLDTVEKEISALTGCFVRVNKSFLVNKKYIMSFSHKDVIMINGEQISLSPKYIQSFFEKMK